MSDNFTPLTPDDERWLMEHRSKIQPLMFALARHLGGERIRREEVEWRHMRWKDGREFMVARVFGMDYWLDPATEELRWEAVDS
jgi:hypothetical protein